MRSAFRLALIMLVAGAGWLAVPAVRHASAAQQGIVVLVNGEPITSYDVAQRQKLLALVSGSLGKAMRARLRAPETKDEFRQFIQQERPTTQEEAKALQKKFVKRLQQKVMAQITAKARKKALEELIEERLMLQEAKRRKLMVSDKEVNQQLLRMAQARDKSQTLDQFLGAFRAQGVDPNTMKQRIKAQLAWRNVIRRLYGFKISALLGSKAKSASKMQASIKNTRFDVQMVRVNIPSSASQKVIAQRYLQGDNLRKRFSSCGKLPALVKLIDNASLKTFRKAEASNFPPEAQAMLMKARAGQMLPPIVSKGAIDLYAVCNKRVIAKAKEKAKKPKRVTDRRQQEFAIYARRHLKDLKQEALIEYR